MSNTIEEMLKTIKPFCTCGMDDNMHETTCMIYQLAFAFKEVIHLRDIADNAMIPCDKCGGGGFAHAGMGYDDVCDDCSGGYTGYSTGQELADLRARVKALEATHVALNAMIAKVAEDETLINVSARRITHLEELIREYYCVDSFSTDDFVREALGETNQRLAQRIAADGRCRAR